MSRAAALDADEPSALPLRNYMNKGAKQTLISAVLIVCGFAAVFVLSNFLERNRPAEPEGYADEDLLLQGAKLKGYSFGFEGLLADWYWMKSLQYIGNKLIVSREDVNLENLKPLNPRLLYPYLNSATDLDPRFTGVYEYGAVVLPAIDKELAIKFTEKGIADNPNDWRLYQYLGYIYWRLGNYEKASQVYADGARIEGAPDFMRLTSARMKTEGGSRATARAVYEQIIQESRDENIKASAALHLKTFDSLDEREAAQKVLDDFKAKNNRCANSWREIIPLLQSDKSAGKINFRVDNDFNLIDPTGAPYILNRENCQIELDKEKTDILSN